MTNLLAIPVPESGERFETLLAKRNCRIEAIVSSDTPDPILYDQPHDEAVLLLSGSATLEINGRPVSLDPGDFLLIPAHTPHRVVRTSHGARWFAIHFDTTLPEVS